MIKIILSFFFLFSVNAFSQDMLPDVVYELSHRNPIHSVIFFPVKDTFFFKLSTEMSTQNLAWVETVGDEEKKSTRTGVNQYIAYGISNRLTLFTQSFYQIGNKEEFSFTSGTETEMKSSGMSEVAIGLRWRAFRQPTYKFYIDLEYLIAPEQGKGKRPGVGVKGNNLRGGSMQSFGIDFARQFSHFEYKIFGKYKMYGDYEEVDEAFALYEGEAYNEILLGIVAQYESFHDSFIQLGYSYSKFDENKKNVSTYLESLDNFHRVWLKVGSHFYQDQFAFSLGVYADMVKGAMETGGNEFESKGSLTGLQFELMINNLFN
ncbi:MAG: hypothetical protein JNM93_09005 [Bacteriovoracaceae bacterium]|nr:hypothetical protein [Bacteriovoracaceae bacterium]